MIRQPKKHWQRKQLDLRSVSKNPKLLGSILSFWGIILSSSLGLAQSFTMVTWNIQDLGRTVTAPQVEDIVQILRGYDLVLIQEVVAKDPAGAQKVAAIADGLSRTGAAWDYRVSDPTQSPSANISERYAILWKPSKLQLQGRPFLDAELKEECDREPFLARFKIAGDTTRFWVVNFHARTHDNAPEEEIRYFAQYQRRLGTTAVVIAGDFNLDDSHPVWTPFFQQGYKTALSKTPTTLKRDCNTDGEYFNYAIDNVFFPGSVFAKTASGRVDFVKTCEHLAEARDLSDHVPVWIKLQLLP
ncbi:MAG: endonuclease/exonuclease/phosphatase family protein [Bacteroidia bacterium]|nr:endonuclease/exonuclease/phosphatase family protein [Bacteroidia bacterium]